MAELPETSFERATQEAREKERLDRQKLLVSLPRSKAEQNVFSLMAERSAELQEDTEDVLLLLGTVAPEELKNRLIQSVRKMGVKAARSFKIAQVAAKEGAMAAEKVFIPAPVYMGLDNEESKILEKFRKDQEAAKKKEATKSESSWKFNNAKKTTPYGYNYGKAGYGSGYGGGSGGLGNWALQQLLSQQLSQGESSGKQKGAPAAAGRSGQQDSGYAARMAAARIQYPCHGCGIHGHWKKDGQCKPVDVANYIKRRMAKQNKKETEDEEEITGMTIYIFRIQLYPFSNNLTHSFGHIPRFNILMRII